MRLLPYACIPALVLGALVLVGCAEEKPADDEMVTELEGTVFGTFFHITLPGEWPEVELEAIRDDVRQALDHVDSRMSTYREDSDLNRLNQAPEGEWVELPESVLELMRISREVADHTRGGFDITVGGLVNLWGFGPEGRPTRIPDTADLEQALAATGIGRLELDTESRRARRQADFFVDLSGIAKGHGVDAVGQVLEQHGVAHFLINIGGDVLAGGRRSAQRPWRIGVEQPDRGDVPLAVPLENMAVTTSGDYRNFFEHNGERFSHIIDPRTGRPVAHGLASVTVLHPSTTWADAYATGLLVLGPGQAMAVAEEHGLKIILITRSDDGFRTEKSPAMRAYLDQHSAEMRR